MDRYIECMNVVANKVSADGGLVSRIARTPRHRLALTFSTILPLVHGTGTKATVGDCMAAGSRAALRRAPRFQHQQCLSIHGRGLGYPACFHPPALQHVPEALERRGAKNTALRVLQASQLPQTSITHQSPHTGQVAGRRHKTHLRAATRTRYTCRIRITQHESKTSGLT